MPRKSVNIGSQVEAVVDQTKLQESPMASPFSPVHLQGPNKRDSPRPLAGRNRVRREAVRQYHIRF
jgi:hypothetical protein